MPRFWTLCPGVRTRGQPALEEAPACRQGRTRASEVPGIIDRISYARTEEVPRLGDHFASASVLAINGSVRAAAVTGGPTERRGGSREIPVALDQDVPAILSNQMECA